LIEVKGISKSFGGLKALEDVSVDIHPGAVHAIVGENGAGKSTFVKILAGLLEPDEGRIVYGSSGSASVAMVHQELTVVPDLTVLDNLLLGDRRVRPLYRRGQFRKEARRRLDEIGLDHVDLDARAGSLGLAEQQLVEIARSVARQASVTVLDEPTATLSDAEIDRVFAALRRLREQGQTILYISHRLKEIFDLADRITTFRNGRLVATQEVGELTPSSLVDQMLGESVAARERAADLDTAKVGEAPVLEADGLTSVGRFRDVSVQVRPGEIVGVLGQVGSGAADVVRALAGLDPGVHGTIRVGGAEVGRVGLRAARSAGLSFLSDSRKTDGLFLDLSVMDNLNSPILEQVSRHGFVSRTAARRRAEDLAARFTVPSRRLSSSARHLSGGNQQKVALAKAVASRPRVLLLNEPTRGVDVGARTEIYNQLRGLTAEGMGILCFTSDVTEINELCDSVVTMFRGSQVSTREITPGCESVLLADILHGGDR
jgi:ABC-type sugar transport system ATPase subunit